MNGLFIPSLLKLELLSRGSWLSPVSPQNNTVVLLWGTCGVDTSLVIVSQDEWEGALEHKPSAGGSAAFHSC